MSKHTPGPWQMVEAGNGEHRRAAYVGPVGPGGLIAFIYEKPGEVEHAANARLIALAPLLLSGAEALLAELDRELPDYCACEPDSTCGACRLRQAVSQAKGGA